MKHLQIFLPLSILALVLVSCMKQPDTAGFKKTVDEFNTVSMESMTSNNTEKVMTYYAENAVSLPPNMEAVKGKEAIEKWMKQMSQSGMKVTKATFETAGFEVSGTIGYEYGTYDMSMEMPGTGSMSDKGNYMSVWTQQQDGSWKIRVETWNSSNPLPSMNMK